MYIPIYYLFVDTFENKNIDGLRAENILTHMFKFVLLFNTIVSVVIRLITFTHI